MLYEDLALEGSYLLYSTCTFKQAYSGPQVILYGAQVPTLPPYWTVTIYGPGIPPGLGGRDSRDWELEGPYPTLHTLASVASGMGWSVFTRSY